MHSDSMNTNKTASQTGPCIVQRNRTILLEVGHPDFEKAQSTLSHYCELVKSPASFHTYQITPLSLWNAAAAGWSPAAVISSLVPLSRWEVPSAVQGEIQELMSRFGKLRLTCHPQKTSWLLLSLEDIQTEEAIRALPCLKEAGAVFAAGLGVEIPSHRRGMLKQELTRAGYPVLDLAGYEDGQHLGLEWSPSCTGEGFQLREYQRAAVSAFMNGGGTGGSGVLVLPCGAGKTVIGLGAMMELQCETLILTSSSTSVAQWINELVTRTTLQQEEIGEYTGQRKKVGPVTVATYQMLTHRKGAEAPQPVNLFSERSWGLIIYDEVHLLPAPVFRAAADIQATRRLGLTATLIREDGREQDVFSLIGPKRYVMPWKRLEEKGWIASADCVELKVSLPDSLKPAYYRAGKREQYRLASENPAKTAAAKRLLSRHAGEQMLIIGQYVKQLQSMAEALNVPLITGSTNRAERERLYDAFRDGSIPVLAVSKVANFAVDLPDASVALEVSGSYGSRQEEAQRLGRILRPKKNGARASFYHLVTKDSREEEFAIRRRMFLIEQGYEYVTQNGDALCGADVQWNAREEGELI
ncbi:DNA repair helicase XPB [Paenibacillus sp. F411]|uniref:DNA repair helicase XPB n=1 Tax=Paenibacillus sp. F411 TaxID=2820239 RepID=UPI001FB8A8E5|nr:DNA repair helicase XPB [Paenibacillus sp. F411]